MKKHGEKRRRITSVLLALMLCITLMPAGAFAQDIPEADVNDPETPAAEITLDTAEESEEEPAEEAALEITTKEASTEAAECTHSSLKRILARKANCIREGNIEYYQCTECGQKFSDAAGTTAIDDADIVIDIDPDAHVWDEGQITREATADQVGEKTYTCQCCGATYTEDVAYVAPVDPGKVGKSFTLGSIQVKFKSAVVETPPADVKNIKPGRVWVYGNKKSIKVSWKNASNTDAIDGVIIMRATGTSKVYKEVARVPFKTVSDGETVVKLKTAYTDTTASKANTAYTYRLVSYFEKDGYTYISSLSDWASGQTSASKLKNVYKGTMNKKSAKLQSKGTVTLKLTVASASTKFKPSSRRWSSSDKTVATVSKKGKVTAKAPGTATISCRLASGYVVTSKITVVGALKPAKPTLKVDYATTSSITLIWNKVKNATSYDVYKSNDGLHWSKTPKNTTKTTITYKNLTKNHRYTFYVVARNDNKGVDSNGKSKTYTALSDNSNVLNQKAVVKRRPMTLTGFPTKATPKTGNTYKVTINVTPPLGRKAKLQMKSGKKWVTKKTITLPKGTDKKSVTITFPSDWWAKTTYWRLVIPATTTTDGVTTDTLKIKAQRRYQNPSSYVQIKNSISKHGYNHYVSTVLVNSNSTKSDHIEAMMKTANKYRGDKYVQTRSGAPGKGVDASGLIIQACYGAGVDLWPISPSTRPYNCVPKIMSSKLKTITYKAAAEGSNNYPTMTRGDLIFFAESKGGTPIHVAIYTGLGNILHADPVKGKVCKSTIRKLVDQSGSYKYYVVGVRRIFN